MTFGRRRYTASVTLSQTRFEARLWRMSRLEHPPGSRTIRSVDDCYAFSPQEPRIASVPERIRMGLDGLVRRLSRAARVAPRS